MTTIIIYAAKTIVCSCAFILLYMWQFHKKVHYRYCRVYLIATMLLSVLIPALNVPIYPNRALQAQSDVQYVGAPTASANISASANASDVAVTNREIVDYFEPATFVAPSANTAAIGDGYAIEQYRLTILHQIFGYTPDLSLGMSNSFTKNRFIMMTQKLNRKCIRLTTKRTLP